MTEKHNCCRMITKDGWPRQCSKSGIHEHDGRYYCSTHHPVKALERHQVQMEKWHKDWDDKKEAARLKDEAQKAMERDAARYRWLRSASWENNDKMHDAILSGMDAMDEAVDAAMTKETP